MKRVSALLLAALMAACCASAPAEEDGRLTILPPEGWTCSGSWPEADSWFGTLTGEDGLTAYVLAVDSGVTDKTYGLITWDEAHRYPADLLQEMAAERVRGDLPDGTWTASVVTAGSGLGLLVYRVDVGDGPYVYMTTILEGWEIALRTAVSGDSPVTEEQILAMADFIARMRDQVETERD